MSKLTAKDHSDIRARLYAVRDDSYALNKVTGELWAEWRDTPKEQEAHSLINSYSQLYTYCPQGTQLTFVFLRASQSYNGNTNRVWKVVTAHNNTIIVLTGYMLNVGVGHATRDEHNIELSGSDADSLTYQLSHVLYGNENELKTYYF